MDLQIDVIVQTYKSILKKMLYITVRKKEKHERTLP